jgi:hypothetical protein
MGRGVCFFSFSSRVGFLSVVFFLCIKNDFTLFPTEVKCACTSFDDSG